MAQIKAAAPTAPRLYQQSRDFARSRVERGRGDDTGGRRSAYQWRLIYLVPEQAEVYRPLPGRAGTRHSGWKGSASASGAAPFRSPCKRAGSQSGRSVNAAAHSPLPTQAQRQQLAAQCTTSRKPLAAGRGCAAPVSSGSAASSSGAPGPTKNACPQWRTDAFHAVLRGGRKGDSDGGANVYPTFQLLMRRCGCGHTVLDDGKPKPEPPPVALLAALVHPVEALEHAGLCFPRDADAIVGHGQGSSVRPGCRWWMICTLPPGRL